MKAKKYRRIVTDVEAMRMPEECSTPKVEKLVEWLQPGLVALSKKSDLTEFEDTPAAPVEDWGSNYLRLEACGRIYTAREGQWVVWDGTNALVLNDYQFREMFEESE